MRNDTITEEQFRQGIAVKRRTNERLRVSWRRKEVQYQLVMVSILIFQRKERTIIKFRNRCRTGGWVDNRCGNNEKMYNRKEKYNIFVVVVVVVVVVDVAILFFKVIL